MVMEKEIWKDIIEYEGLYRVSNIGRVKTFSKYNRKYKDGILRGSKTNDGYVRVFLTKDGEDKGILVHRLVAAAFLLHDFKLDQVNHKNGIKDDNRVINLEWTNGSGNMFHAYANNLKIAKKGIHHPMIRKVAYYLGGKLVKEYEYMSQAIADGFSISAICNSIKRNQKHKGFTWRYLD
jgi:NUMOD4 motif